MPNITSAIICSVMIGNGAVVCGEAMPFDQARAAVERRVLAQSEFWDPKLDAYFYLQPVLPQLQGWGQTRGELPAHSPNMQRERDDPEPHGKYQRQPSRGTMAPIP